MADGRLELSALPVLWTWWEVTLLTNRTDEDSCKWFGRTRLSFGAVVKSLKHHRNCGFKFYMIVELYIVEFICRRAFFPIQLVKPARVQRFQTHSPHAPACTCTTIAPRWQVNVSCAASQDVLDINVCKCVFDTIGKLLKFKRLFEKGRAGDDQRIKACGRKQTVVYWRKKQTTQRVSSSATLAANVKLHWWLCTLKKKRDGRREPCE